MSSLPKLPASEVDLRQSDFKAPILKIPPHHLQSDGGGARPRGHGRGSRKLAVCKRTRLFPTPLLWSAVLAPCPHTKSVIEPSRVTIGSL